ncbi:MAG TPA: IS4 family transposase, partial [Pseudonocardia sp.]|nr:IS4 family transposase [Pseudonocardia sp.]
MGLGECGTHAIVSAAIGTWSTGERAPTRDLLGDFEPEMLVLADRGFYSYDLWEEALRTEAALVFRVPANMKLP